jgi:histidinol-phosphate aminotransferase
MSDSMEPRLRPEISELPTYKAGKKVAPVNGLTAYKLSSNENAHAPLPSVLLAITDAAAEINRYPDPFTTTLTAALADKFGVQIEQIATGTGSVGVCQQIVQAVAGAGDEVMYAWRSFEAYPIIATIAGAVNVQIPLTSSGQHDLGAMLAAITPRTRVIFVCTPNNPTGGIVTQPEIDSFLAKVPKDILVVIDEAYVEFNRDALAIDGMATMKAHTNVGVLRTFSKAYGLAGLRVGYFIGPENIAEAVRKTAVPFGVSGIAQAAAVASLKHEAELFELVEQMITERNWFESQLRKIGFDLPASQANFVWLPIGDRTDEFTSRSADIAVSIRPFPGEGVRISIGERAALERIIELAAEFVS